MLGRRLHEKAHAREPRRARSRPGARAPFARPITATDLATMRRLGAPAASPDGQLGGLPAQRDRPRRQHAGRTDLFLLDLAHAGAQPARIASARPTMNEHDAAFLARRPLALLSQQRLGQRPALAGAAARRHARAGSPPSPPTSAASARADAATGIAIWADRDARCADFDCSRTCRRPRRRAAAAASTTQTVRAPLGYLGRARHALAHLHLRRSPTAAAGRGRAGARRSSSAMRRPSRSAAPRSWPGAPTAAPSIFTLREAGRIEPTSTNLDIFAVPADGSAPPVNLTAANQATDTSPAVSPDGNWLAYAAMARPGYEVGPAGLRLRNLATGETRAADPAAGTARSPRSPGRRTAAPARHRRRDARRSRLPRRRRHRPGRPG